MPDDPPTPEPVAMPPPARRLRAFGIIVISLLLIALPLCLVSVGSVALSYPVSPGQLIAAAVAGPGLCILTWIAAALFSRRPSARTSRAAVSDAAITRAVLALHDLRCPRCGYNLRGLQDDHCPECHEPVVLHVSTSPVPSASGLLAGVATGAFAVQAAAFITQTVTLLTNTTVMGGTLPASYMVPEVALASVFLVGLVLLTVALFKWHRAGDVDGRAGARWRLIRTAIGLSATVAVLEAGWVFYELFW